jgi:hypothetical protein
MRSEASVHRLAVKSLGAAVLLLVLAQCGGAGPDGDKTKPVPGSYVGQVGKDNFDSALTINADAGDRGFPIPRAAKLRTSDTGHAEIFVNPEGAAEGSDKIPCTLQRNTALTVRPSAGVMFAFSKGDPTCGTQSGGSEPTIKFRLLHATVEGRGVFTISARADGTQFVVTQGSFKVTADGQPGSRTVFPNQLIFIPTAGFLSPVAAAPPFNQLPSPIQDDLSAINAFIGDFNFTRSAGAESSTLSRIRREKVLEVAIEGLNEGPEAAFTTSYLNFLSERLNLGARVRVVDLAPDQLASALSSGAIDLVISKTEIRGANFLPLYSQNNLPVTFLASPGSDDSFSQTLKQFLKDSVESGDYAEQYSKSFGVPPYYDALGSLFNSSTLQVAPLTRRETTTVAVVRPAVFVASISGLESTNASSEGTVSDEGGLGTQIQTQTQTPAPSKGLLDTINSVLSSVINPVYLLLHALLPNVI